MDLYGGLHAVFARGSPFFDLVYELNSSGSWGRQVVDARSNYASVAVNASGSPRIAYYRPSDRTVRYAYPFGAGFVNETVEQVEWMLTGGTSLALDAGGRPHLAYWVVLTIGTASIHYAVRLDTGWKVETVADANSVNSEEVPSLALDNSGNPYIAAVYPASQFLAYFSRNGTSWTYEYVDRWNFSTCCEMPSLKLDSMNRPHIAYYNMTGQALRYSHYDSGLGSWITRNIYSETGTVASSSRVSLALDHADHPRISYYENDLNQLRYFSFDGTTWTEEVPDSTMHAGWDNSLVLDAVDAPHILYWWNDGFNSRIMHAWQIWDDSIPPSSSVESIRPYWRKSQPILVNSTATDRGSGVANVTLWYRLSLENVTWGIWTQFGTLLSPPWTWLFSVPDGEGYYEFYSTAVDNVGNAEPPPPTADAIAGYDVTPPVSAALPISPYWHPLPSMVVNATAADNLSGVADITLLYSHAPLDNSSWSTWTSLETKAAQPWSWPFSFPDSEGHYKFHTIASDVAGNIEGAKTREEAIAGYRSPPDYVPDSPLPSSQAVVGLTLSLNLSLKVRNLGGETNETTTLAFYNESTPSSPFLTVQVPPVPPGTASGPFSAVWTSPATPCSCRVEAHVDYGNDVAESNEMNNAYAWTIDVVGGPVTSIIIGVPSRISPLSVTYINSSTLIDFSITDPSGLGIRNTTYTINGGNPVNYTATGAFFLAGEGVHTIEWRSLDWAGNLEQVDSMNLTVDNTPPITTNYQSDMNATTAAVFTLTATDAGCGVNVTRYRIDGGSWAVYSGGFTLSEGVHNISYYSNDMLNNTERERWLVVNVSGAQIPLIEVAVNYKPIVAVMFAIILLVAGVWSSKRRPWPNVANTKAVLKAFSIVTVPFILAESATGVASLLTGWLSIPPMVGIGTAADLTILLAGLGIAISRALKAKPSKAEVDDEHRER